VYAVALHPNEPPEFWRDQEHRFRPRINVTVAVIGGLATAGFVVALALGRPLVAGAFFGPLVWGDLLAIAVATGGRRTDPALQSGRPTSTLPDVSIMLEGPAEGKVVVSKGPPRRASAVLAWLLVGAGLGCSFVSVAAGRIGLLLTLLFGVGVTVVTRGRGALIGLPLGLLGSVLTVMLLVYVNQHGVTLPWAVVAAGLIVAAGIVTAGLLISRRRSDQVAPGMTLDR